MVVIQCCQFVPYTRNEESIILWIKGGNTVKMSEFALLKSGLNRSRATKIEDQV